MSYVYILLMSFTMYFSKFSYISCNNKYSIAEIIHQKNLNDSGIENDLNFIGSNLFTISHGNKIDTAKENSLNYSKEILHVESRKKGESDLLTKILPMMVMPFMMSLMMLPMTLVSIKLMLGNSIFLGKLAIFLSLINYLRKLSTKRGGLYSHNINLKQDEMDVNKAHYGYNGDEEYGAYVNRKKRNRNS